MQIVDFCKEEDFLKWYRRADIITILLEDGDSLRQDIEETISFFPDYEFPLNKWLTLNCKFGLVVVIGPGCDKEVSQIFAHIPLVIGTATKEEMMRLALKCAYASKVFRLATMYLRLCSNETAEAFSALVHKEVENAADK